MKKQPLVLAMLSALASMAHAADTPSLPDVVVNATRPDGQSDSVPLSSTDTATSLTSHPGVTVNAAGGVSGLPAIRGLSSDRIKDYVFDWDRMLSFDGNTAPYLQYAHARIGSIFRRAETDHGIARSSVRSVAPSLAEPQERALALQLLQFDAVVHDTIDKFSPHRLCTYLFDLAQTFRSFYEACPVLKEGHEATRASRLALCDLTARTLACGLELLGITAPERM